MEICSKTRCEILTEKQCSIQKSQESHRVSHHRLVEIYYFYS